MKSDDDLIIRPSPTPFTQTYKLFLNLFNRPPTSIELVREVTVGEKPTSVCHYKSFTYVGHRTGSVHRVDQAGNVVKNFINHKSTGSAMFPWITGIAGYRDKLCLLVYNPPAHSVIVHDLEGHQCHRWRIEDGSGHFYRVHSVSDDSVIIANRPKKEILIYSLTGVLFKTVKCELLSTSAAVYLTWLGRNSILISNGLAQPKFFKVHLDKGTVEWQSEEGTIADPRGVTAYCQDYSLVTTHRTGQTCLWIINHATG